MKNKEIKYDSLKAQSVERQLIYYNQLTDGIKELYVFVYPEYARAMYPEMFV